MQRRDKKGFAYELKEQQVMSPVTVFEQESSYNFQRKVAGFMLSDFFFECGFLKTFIHAF